MGQQPNIELEMSDLPRPTADTAPARGWAPNRPGELTSPIEVPWGGVFGTTGPDTGYALKLISDLDLDLAAGEHRKNVEAAIAAVAGARASRFGRAPIRQDIEVALTIFGFRPDHVPQNLISGLVADRTRWFAGLAHAPTKAQALVAMVPLPILESTPADLVNRMAAGEQLIAA